MIVRVATATAIALSTLTLPSQARDLTSAEEAALASRVSTFETALGASDFATVMSAVPPRVLQAIGDQAGVTPDAVRRSAVAEMETMLQDVRFLSFSLDVETADRQELADGTPYVLLPTETVVETGGRVFSTTSQSLAILDGGNWYLLRLDDERQWRIFRQVYPDYSGIDIEPASVRELEPDR